MMNNWSKMENYYQGLLNSIYPQPDEEGRVSLAREALHWAMKHINGERTYKSLIDLGCGEGYAQPLVEYFGTAYIGIGWGKDIEIGLAKKRNVMQMDFNFLDFDDDQFELGFSSHSLEHSPFPILTLTEWRRVISKYLIVVLPAPEWYHYKGRNHFSVMPMEQCENVFSQSGWKLINKCIHLRQGNPDRYAPNEQTPDEYWFLLQK